MPNKSDDSANVEDVGQPKREASLAAPAGSALTDAQKIGKAIELLERLERECLVPNFAHDAFGSCPICRLISELKAPNNRICDTGNRE